MNVTSVRGGKVHLADVDSPVLFPLCSAGSRNTVTRYRQTPQEVDCKACSAILKRRAARLAAEAEAERQAELEATQWKRAYDTKFIADEHAYRSNISELALASAQENASLTGAEQGFEDCSEDWYMFVLLSYNTLIDGGMYEEPGNVTEDEVKGEDEDMMAGRNAIDTPEGAALLEQIDANIERAASLAEAENGEGLAELRKETEALISTLGGTGSTAVKKEKRDAFAAAALAQPKPPAKAPQAKEGVVVAKTWDQYEGVAELVDMAAERMTEGINAHLKISVLARDIAGVTFDMWLRLPNKAGLPDLRGDSDAAKKASGAMYLKAGAGMERTYENEAALKSLERGVQRHRTDVRAEFLRSLDEDTEEAAERRALFGDALKKKPKSVPYSKYVAATLYGSETMLKGEGEKSRERWRQKEQGIEPAKPAELPATVDQATANEWLLADAQKLKADVSKARLAYYNAASPEAREQAKGVLTEVLETVKRMVAETL